MRLISGLLALILLPSPSFAGGAVAVQLQVQTAAPGANVGAAGVMMPSSALGSGGLLSPGSMAPGLGSSSLALPKSVIADVQTRSAAVPGAAGVVPAARQRSVLSRQAAAPGAGVLPSPAREEQALSVSVPTVRGVPVLNVPRTDSSGARHSGRRKLSRSQRKQLSKTGSRVREADSGIRSAVARGEGSRALLDMLQRKYDGGGERAVGTSEFADADESRHAPETYPKLPAGLKEVSVDFARSAADVDRLVPVNGNSVNLIAELKSEIRRHGEVSILTYTDTFGQRFVGLDVGRNPDWVDWIPELEKHERVLIRKILARYPDVQVLVREQGKTPDLVVNGVVTELKSVFARKHFIRLVAKANAQVDAFKDRHLIARGDLAMDLRDNDVPETRLEHSLNQWAARVKFVALDYIWVYKGDGLVVLRRTKDGGFRRWTPGESRDSGGSARPYESPYTVRDVQLLAKQGMLKSASRVLSSLELDQPAVERYHPISQARDKLEARRAVLKIRKLVERYRDVEAAMEVWDYFKAAHTPETVREFEDDVGDILKSVPWLSKAMGMLLSRDTERMVREIEEPPKVLRRRGIERTVTVYGSARILPHEEAKRLYDETVARVGAEPSTAQGRKELAEAGQKLLYSKYYEEARRFGRLVATHGGGRAAVVTGGGPGIMEGANRGAFEAGGPSVGYNIRLDREQELNRYITEGLSFEFENFPTRKMNLRGHSDALVYFPGGFGTMDELFEVLALMQNGHIPRKPIILVGERDYWKKILDFPTFAKKGMISPADLDLLYFAEDAEQAWKIVEAGGEPAPTALSRSR